MKNKKETQNDLPRYPDAIGCNIRWQEVLESIYGFVLNEEADNDLKTIVKEMEKYVSDSNKYDKEKYVLVPFFGTQFSRFGNIESFGWYIGCPNPFLEYSPLDGKKHIMRKRFCITKTEVLSASPEEIIDLVSALNLGRLSRN